MRLEFAGGFILGLALLPLLATSSSAEELPKAKIVYYDTSHGGGGVPGGMVALSEQLNLDIRVYEESIGAEALDGHDLLCLRAPREVFTEEEQDAIVAFVQSGGSLMLVMDAENRTSLDKTDVNSIIAPFGLELSATLEYLHNCGAVGVAGVLGDTALELPYSGGRMVSGGIPFAFRLDEDGEMAEPFATMLDVESGGRIVVMAEGMASLFMGSEDGVRLSSTDGTIPYWGKDSAQFMEQLLSWLTGS